MKISIIAVGKIKEPYFRDAVGEYVKRLGKYCRLEIIEAEDEKTPDRIGPALTEQIKEKEAKKIQKYLTRDGYTVTLEIGGTKMTSEVFAGHLEKLGVQGISHIRFVIGGSLGLHHSITSAADLALSFSDMTFPHQMMRVILLEQIYRGYRIIAGEPYHK